MNYVVLCACVELKCFLFTTRRAKTPRKLLVKKGSQTNLKDPVGVRPACGFVSVFFFSHLSSMCAWLQGEEEELWRWCQGTSSQLS
jgi:hypothetical protein